MQITTKKIGIFDSGLGGEEFGRALKLAHSRLQIKLVHDKKNLPYGNKSPRQIMELTDQAIQPLLKSDLIVIACNTATAYAIDYLRAKYKDQKFVGFEPAIKIAANQTTSGIIAVLATPATLQSLRYRKLRQNLAKNLTIIEPDVAWLAAQIEADQLDVERLISVIKPLTKAGVDNLVLGCTHYHLIIDDIQKIAPQIKIITPTKAVIAQIERLLQA